MLRDKNVELTALRKSEAKKLFSWINDRDLVLWNSSYRPIAWESHKEWFRSITNRSDVSIFAIRHLRSKRLIGTCQLHSISCTHRSAELAIRIGEKNLLGRGLGTEALRLLLIHGFEDLNLNRIYLTVMNHNKRAIRAYRKIGFRIEGKMRSSAFIGGSFVDVILMGILKREFRR